MRLLYTLAWWLALPLVLARLWLRGRQEPGYRQHWGERLGLYGRKARPVPFTIWLHAVSVGETRAAEPLIDALLVEWPESRIVLTHMTPTGRATGKSLFAKHGTRLLQSYLPYDTAAMPASFIRHFAPRICILMETEVWPNLIHQCNRYKVPVVLANARLSQRSLGKAQRLGKLIADAARGITLVAAQTQDDAARVRQLGVQEVVVTGSIKFDVVVPDAALATGAWLRGAIDASSQPRPVLLCASTREGEEPLILDAMLRARLPDSALLLIVPRHPQRFDEVEKLIASHGLVAQRRSALQPGDSVAPGTQVLLGDSMGEMFAYYAACDCAFVGGSLLPLGGQNLIEPAALGKPVLIGPHTFNFALVTEQAIAAGGAALVANADALIEQASALLQDPARLASMGEKALAFAAQHRGATPRTVAAIKPLLPA